MGGDSQLKKHVEDELMWQPIVDQATIGVGVKALVSELGVAIPTAHKRTDEDIARAVANALAWNAVLPEDTIRVKVTNGWVKAVINDIEVKPSLKPVAGDIKIGIEAAFRRSAEVEARRIHVETRGTTVVLTGMVSSWPERNAAERATWAAPGVSKVENKLLLNSTMAAAN